MGKIFVQRDFNIFLGKDQKEHQKCDKTRLFLVCVIIFVLKKLKIWRIDGNHISLAHLTKTVT